MKKPVKAKPLFNSLEITQNLDRLLNFDLSTVSHVSPRWSPQLSLCISKQATGFTRKFVDPRTPLDLEDETFLKFLDVSARIDSVNKNFCYPTFTRKGHLSRQDRVLLRAQNIVKNILGDIGEEEVFLHCKTSNGVTRGVPFQDTSPERKLLGELSFSGGVDKWFKYYLAWDSSLASALTDGGRKKLIFKHYVGSKAAVVPKDSSNLRMICVEPTLNMFFQQGLMHVMSDRLHNVGLSFDVLQDVHRQLAQISSITQKNATIDWSSASDCVSMSLVRFLLPRTWLHYVESFRCENIEIGGSVMELPMVSTMGNAFTFPLETLVFFSLAVAVCTDDTSPNSFLVDPELFKLVSVFGDDCIVPDHKAAEYIHIMDLLGFIPNIQKSFFGPGGFRESCGGDYQNGLDVRPYSIRAPVNENMSSLGPWLYIVLNRLINRYIHIWGPISYIYDKGVFREIFRLFRENNIQMCIVPTHYPDDAGAKIGYDLARFLRHYDLPNISPLRVDVHGSVHFRFTTFSYRARKITSDNLRYALSLRDQLRTVDHPWFSLLRKGGGYTVAKSRTCFFEINS